MISSFQKPVYALQRLTGSYGLADRGGRAARDGPSAVLRELIESQAKAFPLNPPQDIVLGIVWIGKCAFA